MVDCNYHIGTALPLKAVRAWPLLQVLDIVDLFGSSLTVKCLLSAVSGK